jgi:SAM-dependent methyltransferase
MEPSAYRGLEALEQRHWWFRGRRQIVRSALSLLSSPGDRRVLEIGCGVGGNLALLSEFGVVDAIEPDAWALSRARHRADTLENVAVHPGALPDRLPDLPGRGYDLLVMLDVLEHIADPGAGLRAVGPLLTPDATAVLTVPAYPSLYGEHDRRHHHFRRYDRATLARDLRDGGLEPIFIGHFNLLLLPPAILVRWIQRLGLMRGADEARGGSGAVNEVLSALFALEAPIAPRVPLPAGLSILAIARPARAKNA